MAVLTEPNIGTIKITVKKMTNVLEKKNNTKNTRDRDDPMNEYECNLYKLVD